MNGTRKNWECDVFGGKQDKKGVKEFKNGNFSKIKRWGYFYNLIIILTHVSK